MDLVFPQKIIAELGVPQIVDVREQLPKNPNHNWPQLAGFRNSNDLDTVGLHHDAYPKSYRVNKTPMEMMYEIANDHINSKKIEPDGEGGMPYHIYIMRGTIYYCNDISWRTYGIANENGHVVHVCVHGDYVRFDQLTEADRNCLIAISLLLTSQDPLPNLKLIKGHCELNQTSCPGYDYPAIRTDVETVRNRLAQQDTWEAKLTKIAQMVNQFNYFNSLVKAGPDDGNSRWAVAQQMELFDVMKEKGYV